MNLIDHYASRLDDLKRDGNFRQFTSNIQNDRYIEINHIKMLNLSSNDYLGLAVDIQLREAFFDTVSASSLRLSASSSRLLTGHFLEYEQFEDCLSQNFHQRSALLFNSGYHMNIGILPALCDSKTIILADKLVHASMIDGILLSSAKYYRYRHNDLNHLSEMIQKYENEKVVERIIVVTESIFSMDGDETDLAALVRLKKQSSKVMLYVDEAHAIGVRGKQGLGCVEQYDVIDEIDFIVGTFGKALASVGGYLICHSIIREYLINTMRPLIFSTALAPISIAWSHFIFRHMLDRIESRKRLQQLSADLKQGVESKGYRCPSTSHIVPIIIGDSRETIHKSRMIQNAGFYVMPVRPPTVPQGSSRLRVCLNANIQQAELDQLITLL